MLKLIKAKVCPCCGAELVKASFKTGWDGKILVHVNGQRWELAEFQCGQVVEWIPNFSQERRADFSQCVNDPIYKRALKAKDDLIDRMIEMIRAEERIDVETQDNLIQAFSYKRSRI